MTMMMMRAGCGWRVVPFVQFNNKYLCLLHIFVFSSSFFTFIFFFGYNSCGWTTEYEDKAIESPGNTEPITTAPPIFKYIRTYGY